MPQFKATSEEHERLKRKGEKNVKWHRYFNGPGNIEALAKHLNQHFLYEIMYRKWSGAVHGSDIYLGRMQSTDDPNIVNIVQLRYIKDVQEVVEYSIMMSFRVFRLYIAHRIPEQLNDYLNWYLGQSKNLQKIHSKKYIIPL